jgi:hypothetical protein
MVKSTTKADKSTNAPKQLDPGHIRIPSAKAKATQESPPNEAAAQTKKSTKKARSKIKTELVEIGDEGDGERRTDDEIEEGDKVECAPLLLFSGSSLMA